MKKRMDHLHFLNSQLTEHFDPLMQVKMTMRKVSRLNFVRFPFLFDIDYKNVRQGLARNFWSTSRDSSR